MYGDKKERERHTLRETRCGGVRTCYHLIASRDWPRLLPARDSRSYVLTLCHFIVANWCADVVDSCGPWNPKSSTKLRSACSTSLFISSMQPRDLAGPRLNPRLPQETKRAETHGFESELDVSIASVSSTVDNGARAKTRGFESELDVSIASMSSTVNNGARGKSEACTKFALWQTVLRKHTTTTTITNSQAPTQSRTHRSAA